MIDAGHVDRVKQVLHEVVECRPGSRPAAIDFLAFEKERLARLGCHRRAALHLFGEFLQGGVALKHNLTETVDPEALCVLGGIPRHDASGLPFEVLQTPKRLAFLYLYSTHRFIPTDGRKHDEDSEPRFFGNPIGEWQGDTLVIDSIGFKDEKIWIDENGNPASGDMHAIEKWTRPDADHIHLELVVDDKKYYTRPFTFSRTWVLGKPGEGLTEYSCAENNVDAKHIGPGPGGIGADGNREADIPKKLPDNPPPPEFYDSPPAKSKVRTPR